MASAASKKPGAIKARDGFTSRTLDEPPAEPRPAESALVADGRRPQAQGDPSLKGRGFVQRVSSSMDNEGDSMRSSDAAEMGGASAGSADGGPAGSRTISRTVSHARSGISRSSSTGSNSSGCIVYPFDLLLTEAAVTCIVFYPGGGRLAAGCSDGSVRVMNMHLGEVELCLEGHAEQVNSLAITSKGDMLASGSQDGTIMLWDAFSGELKGKLEGHDGPVFSVDFNPFEPRRLVSGSGDGLVKVWNTQDMVERHSLSGHKDYVLCVKYSPDGHYVASGGGDVSIKFWSTAAVRCVAAITGHDGKGKCKCTPSVKVGQVDSRCTHDGHSNAISCLAFNTNASVIASGSWDKTVRLWSIRIGPDGVFLDPAGKVCPFEHAVLREHENWVKTLCFTRMGDVLATAGNDASIKLWDVKTGALIRDKAGHDGTRNCKCVMDSFGLSDGIRQDCPNGGHEGSISSLAMHDSGWCFASGGRDGSVKVWDARYLAEVCARYKGRGEHLVETVVEQCATIRAKHFPVWRDARSAFQAAKKGRGASITDIGGRGGGSLASKMKGLIKETKVVVRFVVTVHEDGSILVVHRTSGEGRGPSFECSSKFLVRWEDCAAALQNLAEGALSVYIRFFGLRNVPQGIDGIKNLIFLDLSDNDLVRVPVKDLCQVPTLRSLVTLGNPRLFSPPLGVAARGGEANMAYLREAQATGHFNTSVQMFMLGPTESGKSSLVTALLSDDDVCPAPKYGEDIATIGIEEVDWKPPGAGDMEVRIKDMSGQSVYAVTNQRFLVQRALYVITWRLLSESKTAFGVNADIRQTIETWMEYVHAKVPGAYCMLVATHKDSVGLLEAENQCEWAKEVVNAKLKRLTVGSPPLVLINDGDSMQVSSLEGDGVKQLRDRIIQVTKHLPWFEEALPGSFVRMRRKIIDKVEMEYIKVMTAEEMFDLADDCGIIFENHEVAISLFHDLGWIKHFSPPVRSIRRPWNTLQDSIYVNVSWLIDALKGVMRHDRNLMLKFFNKEPLSELKGRLRCVQRLAVKGIFHDKILTFLWPITEASKEFWKVARSDPKEAKIWARDVAVHRPQFLQISDLLEAWFVLIRINAWESLAPIMQAPGSTAIDGRAFAPGEPTCTSKYLFQSVPIGFFEMLIAMCAKMHPHVEFTNNAACLFGRGYSMRLLCYGNNGMDEGSQYSARRRGSNAQATIKVVTGASAGKESPMVMAASREKFSIGQEMQKAFLKGEESILIQAEATSKVQLDKFDAYVKELCGQYPGMVEPYKEEGGDDSSLDKIPHHVRILASNDGSKNDHALARELKTAIINADQANNPEIPLSIDDTFDPKWHEERNSRGVLVFLSSHLQDFEGYPVRPTSSKQSAELFKGKAGEFQTKIDEIEGKLAGFSQERLDEAMQEMGQIQRTMSEHAKSNAKKKGKKNEADPEDAQLEEDLHALEEEIDGLKALKDGEQDMRAQVEKLSASARQMMVRAEFYSQFAGHVEKRHFVIPILLPGFNMSVTECDRRGGKWWPAEMPELEGTQLVDLRSLLKGGDGVNPEELQAGSSAVLRLVNRHLSLWRAERESLTGAGDKIPCDTCYRELTSVEDRGEFDVQECKATLKEWLVQVNNAIFQMSETFDKEEREEIQRVAARQPVVECKHGHKLGLHEIFAEMGRSQTVPCHQCVSDLRLPPYLFSKAKITEYFGKSPSKNPDDVVECPQCKQSGRPSVHRVLDIWCPSIFVSYHRGYKDKNGFYTQELVAPLLDEFEDDVGIDVWSGALARPTAANVEALKEAIARCTVFVVFLSDAYINAPHCQREFLAAVRSGKFVVPVLLPPHANPDGGPDCGWKGPRDVRFGDWWRDADERCRSNRDPDTGIPFNYSALSNFTPVDMRDFKQIQKPSSFPLKELTRQVISRFHRGEHVEHQTKTQYRAWRKSPLFQDIHVKEENYKEALREVFQSIDVDGNDGISKEELIEAFYKRGVKMSWAEADELYKQADANGDGSISFDELMTIVELM